jgi:hypothetical protein
MAKLTAHGGRIVFSAELERATPDGDLTIWERTTYAVRLEASGARRMLRKLDVRFKPDARPYPGEETGRYHSYGWKQCGKLPETFKSGAEFSLAKVRSYFERRGFTVTLDASQAVAC